MKDKRIVGALAMVLGIASAAPVTASPWVFQDHLENAPPGCFVTRSIGPGTSITLAIWQHDADVIIRHNGWNLRPGQTATVELGLSEPMTFVEPAFLDPQTVRLDLDAENGDGTIDLIGWADRLTIGIGGLDYSVNPIDFEQGDALLEACARERFPSRYQWETNQPAPSIADALHSALGGGTRAATLGQWFCTFGEGEIAGVPVPVGQGNVFFMDLELAGDGTALVNGIAVEAAHVITEPGTDRVVGTALDITPVLQALNGMGEGLQSGMRPDEAMALQLALGMLVGQLHGGQDRYLLASVDPEGVQFVNVDAAGAVSNRRVPSCDRVR